MGLLRFSSGNGYCVGRSAYGNIETYAALRTIVYFIALLFVTVACRGVEPAGEQPSPPTPSPTAELGVSFMTRAAPQAMVVQTTPTPLPSPTPTPLPTPILYEIEAGDTLLGIAIQQRTTVDEIRTRNPDVRPELLQIGQIIELPPPATAVAQQLASTPIPLQVRVEQIDAYLTPIGSLWLLGEVVNEGEAAAENVQVEVWLTAADGTPLTAVTGWVAAAVIPAGATAPFAIMVNEPPAAFDYPVVAVVGGQSVVDLGTRSLSVAVIEQQGQYGERGVIIQGRIQNNHEAPVAQIALIATLYDAQGRVSGLQQVAVADSLAPGETAVFHLSAAPPGGEVVDFVLLTQAVVSSQ
ncbi:MAG: FxLYD domain-containing protein [Chloroflexota bacterium]